MPIFGSMGTNGKGKNPFTIATGGTVTDIINYNGTGQTWRTHVFNSSSTFTITKLVFNDFNVLVSGGGGRGGNSGPYYTVGGNGGNGQTVVSTIGLQMGNNSVTVGGSNASSSISTITASPGGVGGDGWSNGVTGGNGAAGFSYPPVNSNITGSSIVYYGGSGGAGGPAHCDGCPVNVGSPGNNGIIIIAYRIG